MDADADVVIVLTRIPFYYFLYYILTLDEVETC